MSEMLKKIINLILENKGKPEIESLAGEIDLRRDLGFDSLDLAELTVRVEKETGVDIFESAIVTTTKEIMMKLSKNG